MRQKIIQFVTGTTAQIQQKYPPSQQQRLILVTDTGYIYLDYKGVRYHINKDNSGGSLQQVQVDWQQTDPTKVTYIKNNPKGPIQITSISIDGKIFVKSTSGLFPVSVRFPSGNTYTLEADSIDKIDDYFTVKMARYLAYQNLDKFTACYIYF